MGSKDPRRVLGMFRKSDDSSPLIESAAIWQSHCEMTAGSTQLVIGRSQAFPMR